MANISISRVSLLTVVIICLTGIPTPSAHAATELMATGELNNVDVTEAMKKGWESSWNTFEGISTVAHLRITADGKCFLTGRVGLIIPMKPKANGKGIEVDKKVAAEIVVFNKGHKITVSMAKGAVALLAGKTVHAIAETTFVLADGDDSQLRARIQDGTLEFVSQLRDTKRGSTRSKMKKQLAKSWQGKTTNGKMWTEVRFTVDLERMRVGPFEILFGFEPKDKGALKLTLREARSFKYGEPFSVVSKPGKWGLQNLANAEVSFSMNGSGAPTLGVSGEFLSARKAVGTIQTSVGSLSVPDGAKGEPCLKWEATPTSRE